MADNYAFTPGVGATGAADDIGGVLYPRVKVVWGADGAVNDASAAAPLPVVQTGTHNIGTVTTVTTVSAVTAISNALPAGNNNIGDVDVASIAAGDNNIGNVDVLTINGVAPAFNAGVVGATTQRVVLASDTVNANGRAAAADSAPIVLSTEDKTALDAIAAQTRVRYVTVSMTTPTDAQDAGDVIAATQIVAACTPANDVPAILHSATLIDTDDVGVNIKAVFFSANTTLGTEDSAPDIDDTEALTVLGIVDFAAADFVDLGGSKYNTKSNLGLAVNPATGTDDIYMALYSPTGGTWASGVITVRLGFI